MPNKSHLVGVISPGFEGSHWSDPGDYLVRLKITSGCEVRNVHVRSENEKLLLHLLAKRPIKQKK